MSQFYRRGGYYDDTGHWVRTKYCFVFCGLSCNCMPPLGLEYVPSLDKTKKEKQDEILDE
jgi:hypothetical protein